MSKVLINIGAKNTRQTGPCPDAAYILVIGRHTVNS